MFLEKRRQSDLSGGRRYGHELPLLPGPAPLLLGGGGGRDEPGQPPRLPGVQRPPARACGTGHNSIKIREIVF